MILDKDPNTLTIRDMKEWLKGMSMTHSYKSKQQYINQFPWRPDQKRNTQQTILCKVSSVVRTHGINWNCVLAQKIGWITLVAKKYRILT